MKEIGTESREKFLNECLDNPARLEDRITRQKVSTFATEAGRKKLSSKDGKIIAECMVRDVFGSLLSLSLEKKVYIAEVLKFPLTPVPLSLSHVNGIMQKTPKSSLMKHLEALTATEAPTTVDVTIIDGTLHLLISSKKFAIFLWCCCIVLVKENNG